MADILVIDKCKSTCSQIGEFLLANGFKVATASDDKTGLQMMEEDPSLRLVMCDVDAVQLDSLAAYEKRLNDGKQLPVIQLTSTNNALTQEYQQQAKSLGVKGWIIKPFNGQVALGAIKHLMNH